MKPPSRAASGLPAISFVHLFLLCAGSYASGFDMVLIRASDPPA
ncbi:hypothetical protein MES4922_190433 [Mesorhizobium ventifaucium]|uniref:Uncharacterized protein n=1 Tax=Mesorhizobium ventifaucium TaxID=666020 RepID=A0ABN8JKB2_9HYPH|nr:hypothetical protein MES4922_190433 [Mesorhizobium ventifaucium]